MPVHTVTQGEMLDTSQESFATLPDIRRSALAGLPVPARDFLEGGAGDEWTLRRNVDAFSDWLFEPRLLAPGWSRRSSPELEVAESTPTPPAAVERALSGAAQPVSP